MIISHAICVTLQLIQGAKATFFSFFLTSISTLSSRVSSGFEKKNNGFCHGFTHDEGQERRCVVLFANHDQRVHTRAPTAYKGKTGLKTDELRRRREEQQVEIRRQKREENISKRRNFLPATGGDSDDEIGGGAWDPPVSAHFSLVSD